MRPLIPLCHNFQFAQIIINTLFSPLKQLLMFFVSFREFCEVIDSFTFDVSRESSIVFRLILLSLFFFFFTKESRIPSQVVGLLRCISSKPSNSYCVSETCVVSKKNHELFGEHLSGFKVFSYPESTEGLSKSIIL